MKTDKPTPIPRRASARKKNPQLLYPTATVAPGPKPIEFHAPIPASDFHPVPLTEEEIKIFVAQCVHEALREHDRLLIHTFYKVVMDWPLAEIMHMGEAEFEARCRSILEDEA